MSASSGVAPARRMALTEAKKLKGVVTTACAGADAGGGQRQPESVGARGAADGVGHAQLRSGGLFKGGYRLAKNELLRLKHMPDRVQQFLVERAVLALEVQHGHGLGRCGWRFEADSARLSQHPCYQPQRLGLRFARNRYPGNRSCQTEDCCRPRVEKVGEALYC